MNSPGLSIKDPKNRKKTSLHTKRMNTGKIWKIFCRATSSLSIACGSLDIVGDALTATAALMATKCELFMSKT